ncbi:MAG: CARDB domain-containing protein [Halovenus sp.]
MNVRRWLGVGIAVAVCLILVTSGVTGSVPEPSESGSLESPGETTGQINEPFDPRPGTFTVTEVSPGKTTADVGETLTVRAIIDSNQQGPVGVSVTLTANDQEVETQTTGMVPQSKFPLTALFEWTPQEPGVYQIAVNDVEARSQVVVGDVARNTSDDDDDTEEPEPPAEPDQFSVVNVSLDEPEIAPGESTTVVADIRNDGDEAGDYEVTLEVDGEAVQTERVPNIQPLIEVGAQGRFDIAPNETGTYTISVNGVETDRQLVVEESGGGGLFSFLGVLGFLPLGLLRTVLLFVGLPILLVFLALKGAAIYLGY